MNARLWTLACYVCVGYCFSFQPAVAAPITGGTGPGGIGATDGSSSLQLWLRGDTLGAVSTNIAAWTDSSGSGYTVLQGGTAPQVYQSAALNGQKAATFDFPPTNPARLTNGTILGAEFGGQNATMFTVYKNDVFPANAHLGITTTGAAGIAAVDLYQGTGSYNGDFRNVRLNGLGLGYPATGAHIKTVVSSNGAFWRLRSDGAQLHSTAQDWGLNPTLTIGADTTHGSGQFNGEIAEIAMFNSVLNEAQVLIVENSHSSRYNIGGTGGADRSLTSSDRYDGDTTARGHYDFDVFGIGRVDASNQHLNGGSAGFGIEAAGPLGDDSWVLAGHKTATNSLNPDGSWSRVWYVDKTETTGIDATLAFDFSDAGLGLPLLNEWTQLNLIYSSTDPFNFSPVAVSGVLNGDVVTFLVPNAQLLDGYYTLQALTVPEPSTFTLLGLGGIGLAIRSRRRRNRLSASR